jgi:cytochrome b subunit of formate dehydrogenase
VSRVLSPLTSSVSQLTANLLPLGGWRLIHDWLMDVSVILFAGHSYLSLIRRSTRHSLTAITRGWVQQDWAHAHHAIGLIGAREPGAGE